MRNPGRADMYMGYYDPNSRNVHKRISRDVEREFLQKFRERVPGYYDDKEWWKKVEEADQPPLEPLVECPQCKAQNLEHQEACSSCEFILKRKELPGVRATNSAIRDYLSPLW